jgi:hypothetical protein
MPKNTVTDLITDQEIAFVHLILSGTMTDRQAAEASGLNPDTAAYTKSKPRVRAYMSEHRAAVNEKLVNQEVEGLRKLNISRDQILDRLWELATLSHEATRGSIAGQIKALTMIVAIEGMIPDRRSSSSPAQPPAPPVKPDIYQAKWLREQQNPLVDEEPTDLIAATKTQPPAPHGPEPTPEPVPKTTNDTATPNLHRSPPSPLNPFINPGSPNWVPEATGYVFDTVLDKAGPFRLPVSPAKRFSRRRR